MATVNPNVAAITGYVEQHTLPLLAKTVLGAKTPSIVYLQTGVKGKTALNILSTDVEFGCGENCGFNETGATTYSQREIDPAHINIDMAICDRKLLDTWANYEVKVAAGQRELPFAEEWTNEIVKNTQDKLEKFLWNGGTVCEKEYDGYVAILEDAEATVDAEEGATNYKAIVDGYLALPAEVQAADDVVAFVSYPVFNALVQEVLAASHYHLDTDNTGYVVLPGTQVKVYATQGLSAPTEAGDTIAVIGRASNFVYGVDMASDSEVFDLWYSKDQKSFMLNISFNAGMQIAFPDEALLVKKG